MLDLFDIWDTDDQQPSCDACLKGEHGDCPDLMWSPKYGMYACGCTNNYHVDEYEA